MSLEITLICNRCGALMASVSTRAPRAGAMVRAEARGFGARVGLPGGTDYCRDCWSDLKATRVRLVDGQYVPVEDPASAQRSAEGAHINEGEQQRDAALKDLAEAQRREELMRPVVEAALRYDRAELTVDIADAARALIAAVDTYETQTGGTE